MIIYPFIWGPSQVAPLGNSLGEVFGGLDWSSHCCLSPQTQPEPIWEKGRGDRKGKSKEGD